MNWVSSCWYKDLSPNKLNQCLVIVNWTPKNKLQLNFNKNTKRFIHWNSSENIVCEMPAILARGISFTAVYLMLEPYVHAFCSVDTFPQLSSCSVPKCLTFGGIKFNLARFNYQIEVISHSYQPECLAQVSSLYCIKKIYLRIIHST